MSFEQRPVNAIEDIVAENFKINFDGNTLYISAMQSIGTVNVFSISGAKVISVDSNASNTQINLSALPKGAYIVQAGTNKVKIIK
jgi:hypothetical protein